MTKEEIIEELAQQRTENAEIPELESIYLDYQKDMIEWYDQEDLITTYKNEIDEDFTVEDLTDE